jgi:hypothetical protein
LYDDLARELLHTLIERLVLAPRGIGLFTSVIVTSVSTLVVSGPRPGPSLRLDLDQLLQEIVKDISLGVLAGIVRVGSNVGEHPGDDRLVQVEDGRLLVVFLGRKSSERLVQPQTLDLRVLASSIALDLKVDEPLDTWAVHGLAVTALAMQFECDLPRE